MHVHTVHYEPLTVCLSGGRNATSSGTTVVTVTGEVDASTVAELATALGGAIDSAPQACVIDLSHVDFLSIAAAEILADGHARAALRNLDLHLVPGRAARHTLVATDLLDTFRCHRTTATAVDDIRAERAHQQDTTSSHAQAS
ncbi:STAS domain-containing protein [Rhodococcus sp. NPDC003318]|uniref:STAS domain-containing protein n=1 Tax=Rhodococcus sp. NPDC003318 TaxID=3364503 RepID=UPI00367E619D